MANYQSIIGSLDIAAMDPPPPGSMAHFKCGWEMGYGVAYAYNEDGDEIAYNCNTDPADDHVDVTLSLARYRVYLLRPRLGLNIVSRGINCGPDKWRRIALLIREGSI